MSDAPIGSRTPHPWRGRLIAIAAVVCLALVVWPDIDLPHALVGVTVMTVAALVVARTGVAPLPQTSASRPARTTDLTIEGLIAALAQPTILIDRLLVVRSHNLAAQAMFPALKRGEALTLALRAPDAVDAVRRAFSSQTAQAIDLSERVPVARWFRLEAAPVRITARSRDGAEPDFVLVGLRDLSEERRLEQFRTDFVANASHELRTPLASLVGFIETIQGPARNDPGAREKFLGIMLAQAQRMARLIDDLMSLSRVESNEHVRPVTPVDIVPLVGHVRDILAPFAAAQGVSVEVAASPDALVVAGDRDELIRLLENLMQNAIKYGAEGKRVVVSVRRETRAGRADEAVVAVTDFGPGIAAEHLPRLTERFYRIDVTSSRDKGGTGLGLALVKHIVNRHRGRLTIESEPGKGATFTVRLDAQPQPAGGVAAAS